jgi:hypothetical protein
VHVYSYGPPYKPAWILAIEIALMYLPVILNLTLKTQTRPGTLNK